MKDESPSSTPLPTAHLPTSRPLVLVTVGSDHHRFDRLVRWVDAWAGRRAAEVDCVVQHGPALAPRHALGVHFMPHDELTRLMAAATAVVVQGGPMSIVESRAAGRLPIVAPRLARLDEVVDDHQVVFSRRWAREGMLTLAEEEAALHGALDAVLADPARGTVVPDPQHDEQIARSVERVERIATDIMCQTPGDGPDVVMIGGAGRSGSTLLERCLAEVPGVTGLGEVLHLWERGLNEDQLCGCGQRFSVCPFWTEVGTRAFDGWSSLDPDECLTDRARVVRNRYLIALTAGGLRPSWRLRRKRLLRRLDRLYRAVQVVDHSRLVVDSSKHPAFGYLLRSASIRLRCIVVVRDPRGVAHSWAKTVRRPEVTGGERFMPRYSAGKVAVDWLVYRAVLRGLGVLGVPLMVVRYEDLVRDPRRTVADVLTFCGIRPTEGDLKHITVDSVTLGTHHTVAGNPMRFRTGRVDIKADEAWRKEMPRGPRMLVGALTAPVRLWDAWHHSSRRP